MYLTMHSVNHLIDNELTRFSDASRQLRASVVSRWVNSTRLEIFYLACSLFRDSKAIRNKSERQLSTARFFREAVACGENMEVVSEFESGFVANRTGWTEGIKSLENARKEVLPIHDCFTWKSPFLRLLLKGSLSQMATTVANLRAAVQAIDDANAMLCERAADSSGFNFDEFVPIAGASSASPLSQEELVAKGW